MGDKFSMNFSNLAVAMFAFSLVACANTPEVQTPDVADETDQGDDGSDDGASAPDAGSKKDAGKASSSSSNASSAASSSAQDAGKAASSTSSTSSSVTAAASDAGKAGASGSTDAGSNPLDALGGLFGGGATGGDASTPASTSGDGGADHCGGDLVCFDIFDCAIWHLDAIDCGFTKCEDFVCKK
jgi:hypothetical protein